MQIISYNIDPKQSTYKFGKSTKTFTYDETFAEILKSRSISITSMTEDQRNQITAEIFAVHNNHTNSISESEHERIKEIVESYLPPLVKQLNKIMIDGFRNYISWTADRMGNKVLLVRTNSEGNTWRIVDDLCSYVRGHVIGDQYIIEHLSKYYYQSVINGGVYMASSVDPDTGKWSEPKSYSQLYIDAVKVAFSNKAITREEAIRFADRYKEVQHNPNRASAFTDVFVQGGEVYKLWEASKECNMAFPVTITNDKNKPAFSYINLDNLKEGKTPDFDGWLEIMPESARGPFMASLYAAVTEGAHISQVIYLHGEGNDGKGELFRSFEKAFGEAMVGPVGAKDVASEFGSEGLIGKRMIFVGDLQSGNFLNTNLVHAITGGDTVLVNRKNDKHISYKFDSILFVAANTAPEINMSLRNEARRIFYIPISEPSELTMRKYCLYDEKTGSILRYANGMPKYKGYDLSGSLVKEMPAILYKCKKEFAKYYGNRTLILPDAVYNYMLEQCGSNAVDVLADFASKALEIGSSYSAPTTLVNNAYLAFVHGPKAINNPTAYPYELRDFKRFLQTEFKCKVVQQRDGDIRQRVYKGVKLKIESIHELYQSFHDDLHDEKSSNNNKAKKLIDIDIIGEDF